MKGGEIIGKIKFFGIVIVTMLLISVTLFASGCSQREQEDETGGMENKTDRAENGSRNLMTEVEGAPQEISDAIKRSDRNIIQTLADRNFVTLVELINIAGLNETLAEDGIYTVFAPTDEAFDRLPENAVPALKNNTPELRRVLTYHVVDGKILMENDIKNLESIRTLEGGELSVNVTATGIQIEGANITDADIITSNGVIHQIDKVLIPLR